MKNILNDAENNAYSTVLSNMGHQLKVLIAAWPYSRLVHGQHAAHSRQSFLASGTRFTGRYVLRSRQLSTIARGYCFEAWPDCIENRPRDSWLDISITRCRRGHMNLITIRGTSGVLEKGLVKLWILFEKQLGTLFFEIFVRRRYKIRLNFVKKLLFVYRCRIGLRNLKLRMRCRYQIIIFYLEGWFC